MRILLGLLATFVSTSAFAHTGHGDASGLMHGLMHPIGGLDHVLAMVAVGVLAYLTGGRMRLALPLSFMSAMLVGGLLGMSDFQLPLVETAIGASIVVLAGLSALGAPLPAWLSLALTAFFGIFHGFAHGAELPLDASGLTYGAGFIAATGLLHAFGIAAAFAGTNALGAKGRTATRIGSGAIVLAGVAVLSGTF